MLQGTNLFGDASATLAIALTDKYGYAMFASCTGTPPTTAGIFQHGALIVRTDSGTGTNAVYQNTGSVAVPSWTLLDTGVEQDATVLVDSNGITSVSVGTTASAVNGLVVTNSATGAVSANAVTLIPGAPSGSDAAISITLAPKGVTGLTRIGTTDGTGTITVGSSSGAQTLVLGGGAGVSTVQIAGGSAANVVTIANVQTAGSITMGNAMTSGTIQIGGASMTTGTTTIYGGTGTGAVTVTPGVGGTIVIGNSAGTGAITLGSSSTTQTTNIGTGAGVSTINVGTGAAANVITVGAASSKVTLNGSAVTSYQAINYQGTEGGANNAITCNLVDAAGTNITLAAGLRIAIKLAHSLQAGANTLALNGGATKSILSHRNPANNIATAYVSGGIIELMYDGTQWQDLSQ